MLIISDLHWRCDTPSWRTESDYSKMVLRPQLGALLDVGEPVIVCGDVFHRAADFAATYDLFTFLKARGAVLHAVRGQHDMLNHNDAQPETGFNLLVKAGLIVPLGATPIMWEGHALYGAGWEQDVPDIHVSAGWDFPILIAHVSISHGDAVIPGATTAAAFREKAKDFRLVFTGDNHKRFNLLGGLYNAGCFHQMTADLEDQEPLAWRVTLDGKVAGWVIPHETPLIDESYREAQTKGKAAVAGAEFVKALSEARQKGGGDVFLAALKTAEQNSEGGTKALLGEIVKLCEESHT